MGSDERILTGGCACGALRYRLLGPPLVVHACHCRDCQHLTGSAFVINLWIERERVQQTDGAAPRSVLLHGGSGAPHEVFSCARCGGAVWSRYHVVPGHTLLVRGGTLDLPEAVVPDIHLFTRTKLPWVALPPDAVAFDAGYEPKRVWPPERYARLRAHIDAEAAAATG